MSIKKMVADLDYELTQQWSDYLDLHTRFDSFRGKMLDNEYDINEVNKILKEIQDKFEDMYHAFNFINYRHQMSLNAVNGYTDFIETIKKAGAQAQEKK